MSTASRSRRCARTRSARPVRASTGHGSRIRISCGRDRVLRRGARDRPNQVERQRDDVVPDEAALLSIPDTPGEITERGLRTNVSVGIRYLDAWLHGVGAAAIDKPDGGRADGRDLAFPGLAVGAGGTVHARAGCAVRPEPSRPGRGEGAFPRPRTRRELVEFLTLPAYNSSRVSLIHQGRRHRARDRGGDRLGRARARDRPRQEQLSEQFNVSRTPVREALRRLAALGLVSFVPNRACASGRSRATTCTRRSWSAPSSRASRRGRRDEDDRRESRGARRGGEALLRICCELRAKEPGEERRAIMGEWVRRNHAFHDVIYRAAGLPLVEQLAKSARRTFSGPAVWAPGDHSLDELYVKNAEQHRAIKTGSHRRQRLRRSRTRPRARDVELRAARDDPRAGRRAAARLAARPRRAAVGVAILRRIVAA